MVMVFSLKIILHFIASLTIHWFHLTLHNVHMIFFGSIGLLREIKGLRL